MEIGLTYNRTPNNFPLNELSKSIKKKGHIVVPFRPADIACSIEKEMKIFALDCDLTKLDLVFLRTLAPGTIDQITLRISAFDILEKIGTPVINSSYPFRTTKDKFSALAELHLVGIPVPKTFVAEPFKLAFKKAETYKDVVIKPLVGSRGFGILKTETKELSFTALKFLSRMGQVSYIQEFIPHGNQDIRAFVIGEKVIAAMHRKSKSWKSNIAQGAKAKSIKLSKEIEEIAIKATSALNLDYSGVDIIEGEEGPIVIEVNAAPSWFALQSVTKINIADEIVDYSINKIKK
ncbi:MAG: RimK family alpha-L-glutamate ligase [Candidatus Ranarchaeia archaeon]